MARSGSNASAPPNRSRQASTSSNYDNGYVHANDTPRNRVTANPRNSMLRAARPLAFWVFCWMAAPLASMLGAPGSARAADPAPHASTAAERQARGEEAARSFVLGRYEEALATYLDLYIQSDGRPEYLRNIGRCQQKLKQYPRAIESFKDYLKRARHLSADE